MNSWKRRQDRQSGGAASPEPEANRRQRPPPPPRAASTSPYYTNPNASGMYRTQVGDDQLAAARAQATQQVLARRDQSRNGVPMGGGGYGGGGGGGGYGAASGSASGSAAAAAGGSPGNLNARFAAAGGAGESQWEVAGSATTTSTGVARSHAPGGRKPRGRALLIGINYTGSRDALNGCINDVRTMQVRDLRCGQAREGGCVERGWTIGCDAGWSPCVAVIDLRGHCDVRTLVGCEPQKEINHA